MRYARLIEPSEITDDRCDWCKRGRPVVEIDLGAADMLAWLCRPCLRSLEKRCAAAVQLVGGA